MKLKAYAKINLALFVTGRRDDGYHEVDMIMQTISLHDDITVELTDEPGIHLTMNTEALPTDEKNIAYRTAKMMLDEYRKRLPEEKCDPGVKIHIGKHIPVAAGMAGGSTDCAAVIRALNTLLKLNLSKEELMDIGVKLGADVPFCIQGGTMRSQGIGEILTGISPMPECFILTAKPDYGVSTKEVYQGIDREMFECVESVSDEKVISAGNTEGLLRIKDEGIRKLLNGFDSGDIAGISGSMHNDLEKYTVRIHRDIDDLKKIMLSKGALGALMSGSGPTVFAIFDDMDRAEEAKRQIISLVPGIIVNISKPVNVIC